MAHRESGSGSGGGLSGPTERALWLALAIAVPVLAVGLLWLRSLGLSVLGARGVIAVFVLGEVLGVGGVVFAIRAQVEAPERPQVSANALATARRWVLSGLVFLAGMALIAIGARFAPTALAS